MNGPMVRIVDSITSLCLRYSKGIAIVWLLIGLAGTAAATRIRFAADPAPDGDHIVAAQTPQVLQSIASGFRSSAHAHEVKVSGERVVVRPRQPARNVEFARELLAETALIEASALKEFQKRVPAGTPLPRIEDSGAYRFAVEQADRARRGLALTTLLALILVLASFAWIFRDRLIVLYTIATLFVSLAVMFGVAGLVFGTMTVKEDAVGAVVVAMCAAFSVSVYARYRHSQGSGGTAERLIDATRATIPRVIGTGFVIAIASFALYAAGFRFGLLSGVGALVSAAAAAMLLPSLIAMTERSARRR